MHAHAALHPILTGVKAAWAGTQCTNLEVKECAVWWT